MANSIEQLYSCTLGRSIKAVEDAYYQRIGVRKEFPELNPIAAGLLMFGARRYVSKHHSVIEGELPKEGAAIVTGNHFQKGDSLKILWAGRVTAGRLPTRTIVKMSLIKRGAHESAEYLRSIGTDPANPEKYSPIEAFALRNSGVIGILRDNPRADLNSICNEILKSGQWLGVYMQPTRDPEYLLRNLQPGAAIFAMRHPDIPVIPLAFSGPPDGPDKISIRESFTYAQKRQEWRELGKKLGIAEFTIVIADAIAEGLPLRPQKDWETRREVELERLRFRRGDLVAVKQSSIELSVST